VLTKISKGDRIKTIDVFGAFGTRIGQYNDQLAVFIPVKERFL